MKLVSISPLGFHNVSEIAVSELPYGWNVCWGRKSALECKLTRLCVHPVIKILHSDAGNVFDRCAYLCKRDSISVYPLSYLGKIIQRKDVFYLAFGNILRVLSCTNWRAYTTSHCMIQYSRIARDSQCRAMVIIYVAARYSRKVKLGKIIRFLCQAVHPM